ncbi:peptide chain release factor N(5)-glutamine methyltransferase [Brachybacterium sp. DNPG3]
MEPLESRDPLPATDADASAVPPRLRLRAALAETTARLGAAGVPSPSVDARALIAEAAGTDRPLVLLDELPEDFDARLAALVGRRASREPLQLILGRAPFRRLTLRVRPGVFIPRPETELAIDIALEEADALPTSVVDLCTGSGALAAAALDELPAARVLAVELDAAAAELARENTEAAGPGRGRVLQADLLDADALDRIAAAGAAPGTVDLLLSNPPYVPPDAIPRDLEVREHDPERALYGGGADGMEVPRRVVEIAAHLLRPGGILVMEHADVQGAIARQAAHDIGGFTAVRTARDLTGRDRFLVARRGTGSDPLEVRD